MMPDLGKYAVTVLSAYGATGVILLALLVMTFRRGRRVRSELGSVETRMRGNG